MKKSFFLSSIFCTVIHFKLSYIIGSVGAHFSAFALAGPIIGFQSTFSVLITSFAGFCFGTLLYNNTSNPMISLYHIPSCMGMIYMSLITTIPSTKGSRALRQNLALLIPASCIGLFCTHHVGYHAWPYALLWIFPCIAPFLRLRSFFWSTLASTLACHAVGSVLWIFTHQLTAKAWLGLLPITIAERLSIAAISTALYYGINTFRRFRPFEEHWNKCLLWIKLKISHIGCNYFFNH